MQSTQEHMEKIKCPTRSYSVTTQVPTGNPYYQFLCISLVEILFLYLCVSEAQCKLVFRNSTEQRYPQKTIALGHYKLKFYSNKQGIVNCWNIIFLKCAILHTSFPAFRSYFLLVHPMGLNIAFHSNNLFYEKL